MLWLTIYKEVWPDNLGLQCHQAISWLSVDLPVDIFFNFFFIISYF